MKKPKSRFFKNICLAVSLALAAIGTLCEAQPQTGTISPTAVNVALPSAPVIMDRDANSRIWGTVSLETNEDGSIVSVTNQSYVELATGICHTDPTTGQFVDSVEEIGPVPGGAAATQGRHQVQFWNSPNTPVIITMPDGAQMSCQVY
jgi:hypothetical protein